MKLRYDHSRSVVNFQVIFDFALITCQDEILLEVSGERVCSVVDLSIERLIFFDSARSRVFEASYLEDGYSNVSNDHFCFI